ncbi:MAG: single-stranded-DNA-specific exonuclease RecJ [Leptolyngbyaceae cyanobacterium bins.59]|nr:single-stranded-DNA-specific exonuclease RecJ [Leptolyngbyaceae cyanobacterium bins.59]
MPNLSFPWQLQVPPVLPDWFVATVDDYLGGDTGKGSAHGGQFAAQLLWQRGIREPTQLTPFLNPNLYQPTSPFAFGDEMRWAVGRLLQAREEKTPIAIWGDFDADGVTATAVLWEGLGQFFPAPEQLTYSIPNRFTESHGLSCAGIDRLADQGYRLIVTCDTGSTNLAEIHHARSLGIDLIITDHHTLLADRPPVTAILNPRILPPEHPLAHLSGVAVAYKLVEALYQTLPQVPQQPLEALLDLVAIGLIADLVQLTGDCRYLAQRGIEHLQRQSNPATATRPGVARLLELCQRNGDRPTDIAFGLGPRINAVSRIQGDAHFCVELLTSQDPDRCNHLAESTELANTRRKALQKDLLYQVRQRLAALDLTTRQAIVLMDSQWPPGILGLVAGQLAQEYDRPVILLIADPEDITDLHSRKTRMARGSARSISGVDLYQLFQDQAHLLDRFGGHPLAAGLSLPVENVPLFTDALQQKLRQQGSFTGTEQPLKTADLTVTVADLGRDLFRELKLIEPCGMGNPVPKLLLQNCWFTTVQNRNIQDWQGKKLRYIKTEFNVWDESCRQGFPGVWWEHYRDEVPTGRCDAIVELDYNAFKQRYEVRLIALRSSQQSVRFRQKL